MSAGEPPVVIRLFAAAAEAVGSERAQLTSATIGQVLAELVAIGGPETARVLARCAVLVDGARVDGPAALVPPGVVVDVLPPFAGG